MPTVVSVTPGMLAEPSATPPPALLQPAQEDVYLLYGLEVAVLLGNLPALVEDLPRRGVFVELEVGAAQHPVRDRVIRLVLDRALKVVPGLLVAPLFEELAAERVEDHGVCRVLLE